MTQTEHPDTARPDLERGNPLDLEQLVDTWLLAYAEPDRERRRRLVDQVWAADGHLADPPFEGTGGDAIVALADAVLDHFPGHRFRRTTVVDEHHGVARYGWVLEAGDGTVAVAGTDIARLDGTGRLQEVVGFFGEAAELG